MGSWDEREMKHIATIECALIDIKYECVDLD